MNNKKVKIAILTWRLKNFGTALQSYALYHWLLKNEVDCKVINYTLPASNAIIRVNKLTVKDLLNKIRRRITNWLKSRQNASYLYKYSACILDANNEFNNFYETIPKENILPSISNSDYFKQKYDCIIVGSDQVWSPKYLTETYFLDFVPESKRVAYAPSIGVSSLTREEKLFISERIKKFRYVSVREKTSAKILGIKNDLVMCDPVLLFDAEEWKNMLQIENNVGDYLFIYFLSAKSWYKDIIEQAQKICGVERVIIVTTPDNLYFYDDSKYEINVGVGPKEWIQYLYNSTAVITDSFHGVCFSAIFNKKFLALKRFSDNDKGNENARVTDLLDELGLKRHIIQKGERIGIERFSIDLIFNQRLTKFRRRSVNYLLNIIKSYSSAE